MMRPGNFARPSSNFRGQGNFNRNQGNFNRNQGQAGGNYGRYPNQQSGGFQGQGNNYAGRQQNQGKSPGKYEPPKKTPTPTKPTKPDEVKTGKPEQKQELKTQMPPPAQSPKKEATTTPTAQKVTPKITTPVKKDEPAKPTGNGTSTPKGDASTEQKRHQSPKSQQAKPQDQQNKPPNFQNQKQDRPQNNYQKQDRQNSFQRQDRQGGFQKKQYNKQNRERDSSYSRDQQYQFTEQGPKEEKKFTGRCRLFVGNLTPDVTEEDFKKMFEQYGEVSEAYVNSGRGFGFIRMDYRHNAEAAKAALDGLQKKGRTLRVRFATHGAALKVKNIHGYASNELLENAFQQFGDLERAIVIVDDRGKPTGDGIVEFVRKPGAQQALRRINDGIFLLGSSPRPLSVEPLEQTDEDDGMPEKFLNKNEGYKKEREKEPRFAMPGSFECEFAQRWRQIDEMEKERIERVKKEMEDARLRLDDEMQGALIEYQAEQIRKDLMRQQEELRRLEEMRQQDQMRRRQDMEMRQREEERMRVEEDRRLQEMMMNRHGGPMDQSGPRGRDEMMGGMRDGPRGMKDGAPPLPPPPAPPAGMGLDRSGRPSQMSSSFGGSSMGSGMGSSGQMGGSGSQGGSIGGMGGSMRQSRFDQQGGSFEGGFQSGGGMGGPMGGSMSSGQGNMFGSQGMGGSNNMGGGNGGPGMRGERMDRRREGGPREEYGDLKRRRY
ncbi:non-POU domain-containing octamer-binding protein-like isoform X2 [Haliotis cracherodii]|uniref:non-POU domain-containing octamer-binding protein-like isoform X2 n=1 Tax=Haliotis cracherodii TaxID=6455 RepID=UPI0039EC45F2